VYGAFLTTIISKHGGNHEWDVTAPEVMTILYVRRSAGGRRRAG
jgi:hypothetical protein